MEKNIQEYRKKPVVIQAIQITVKNKSDVCEWAEGALTMEETGPSSCLVYIETLEGKMKARVNDWIIKGVEGGFYPCRDSVFKATYELVEQ